MVGLKAYKTDGTAAIGQAVHEEALQVMGKRVAVISFERSIPCRALSFATHAPPFVAGHEGWQHLAFLAGQAPIDRRCGGAGSLSDALSSAL